MRLTDAMGGEPVTWGRHVRNAVQLADVATDSGIVTTGEDLVVTMPAVTRGACRENGGAGTVDGAGCRAGTAVAYSAGLMQG